MEGRYRPKAVLRKQPCKTRSRFLFGWNSLAQAHANESLPLENAILRAYVEVITRLLNNQGTAEVQVAVYMKRIGRNEAQVYGGTKSVTVTASLTDWVEFNVTEGLSQLWPPTEKDRGLEVTLILTTDCSLSRKVPAQFINPATIPLSQQKRRERLSYRQPFMVISLSDEIVKEIVRGQSVADDAAEAETVTVQGSGGTSNSRRKREVSGCRMEPYSVNFGEIRISYIQVPASYNAMQCVGSCNHDILTINPHYGNNHAKIMAGSRAVYDIEQRAPSGRPFTTVPQEPCCVPTKYDPLPVIELGPDRSIKYNVYPSMIVKACGCR